MKGMKWKPSRVTFWYLALSLAIGAAVGLNVYTFIYAKGYSYLSNDPKVCMNCHVMKEQYDGWVKSTHHAAASCNDCHTPENLAGKYKTKMSNGFWHSFYFTAGNFHEPIRIKPRNREVLENNCRRCHQQTVLAMDSSRLRKDRISCVSCHERVGHW